MNYLWSLDTQSVAKVSYLGGARVVSRQTPTLQFQLHQHVLLLMQQMI
jgi:hypothetical protein